MHCGAGPTRPGVLHGRAAPLYVAALIASVAIDVDNIPLYLGLLGERGWAPGPAFAVHRDRVRRRGGQP